MKLYETTLTMREIIHPSGLNKLKIGRPIKLIMIGTENKFGGMVKSTIRHTFLCQQDTSRL